MVARRGYSDDEDHRLIMIMVVNYIQGRKGMGQARYWVVVVLHLPLGQLPWLSPASNTPVPPELEFCDEMQTP